MLENKPGHDKQNVLHELRVRFNQVREDVKTHNCWLQLKCCSIQEQCIAFPI